jgi:hypothetical protein
LNVVNSNIMEVDSTIISTVVPPDICERTVGLDYNRDAMQLVVSGMKDVSWHRD